jgi:hypothetical protein
MGGFGGGGIHGGMAGMGGGGFHAPGSSGGFRGGGFAGVYHGGFHDHDGGGFRDHDGFRGRDHDRDFDHRFIGFGFNDYYYDNYPYDYSYANGDSYYDNGGCYLVRRRVHTSYGWRTRLAQVCG